APLGHRKCLADTMEHKVRCLIQLCHFLHRRLELERFQCVIPDIVRGIQHFVTTLCCDCQTACYGVGLVAHLFSKTAPCRNKQQFFIRRLQIVSNVSHRGSAGDRYDCPVEKHLLKFFSHHFGQFLLKFGVAVRITVHNEKVLEPELFPEAACKIAAAVNRRDVGG